MVWAVDLRRAGCAIGPFIRYSVAGDQTPWFIVGSSSPSCARVVCRISARRRRVGRRPATLDGRLLVSSQSGELRIYANGTALPNAALSPGVDGLNVICANHERGLLGVAVDPAFVTNHAARDQFILLGKILRIQPDGTLPADNPWMGADSALLRPRTGRQQNRP